MAMLIDGKIVANCNKILIVKNKLQLAATVISSAILFGTITKLALKQNNLISIMASLAGASLGFMADRKLLKNTVIGCDPNSL